MPMFSQSAAKTFADCSGCSLCLLVCPVWRLTRDIELTPHGRAKALQNGAGIGEIAASLDTCTLCMSCDPVCPENINLSGIAIELRRAGATTVALQERQARVFVQPERRAARKSDAAAALLADSSLHARPELLARIAGLLGVAVSNDAGADIALALEAGVAIAEQRLQEFLAPLRRISNLVVADGLLLRFLREHLPSLGATSLGEALSNLAAVRHGLRPDDLYVIEPRAYHSDYQRLVLHYDRLRAERGCAFNLDLQRIAIPVTVLGLPQRLGLLAGDDEQQTRWLLQGRKIRRIVVESLEDCAAFARVTDIPVVHLAELAVDEFAGATDAHG
jgi:ferredoxin